MDEYDIRESFDSLDNEKLGYLSLDQFYVLYLGLGYPQLTKDELKRQVGVIQSDQQNVTVETVIKVLKKVRPKNSRMSLYTSF